ncbi:HNH endonuclease [Kitasatospora sp. NPDC098663]|uniref:HNH endonuclease n=1 Tax=Kitasatospora sp. NPDC098663 TaxID=3364096 RepID=UPI00380F7C2F
MTEQESAVSGVVIRGPLGDVARLAALQHAVHAEDAYAAAVCWWSAAVAPAAAMPGWRSCVVWGAFLAQEKEPSLATALQNTGLEPRRFPHLGLHPDITTETALGAARAATTRRTRPGTAFSMLLTGSPIKNGTSRKSSDEFLASTLRVAWDGEEYRPDSELRLLRRLGPVGIAPRIGVLWEMPEQDWRYEAQTSPASSTRFLIFRRRQEDPHREPDHRRVIAAAVRAVEELTHFYDDLSACQVDFTMTGEAAEKFWPIRLTEDCFDSEATLPESQFFRLDDHTHRIAAALALAEGTQVITGGHIEAAWSLVSRSCRDRAELLCPGDLDLVEGILRDTGAQVSSATGSPQTPPPKASSPHDAARGTASAAVPTRGARGRNGKVKRDSAVIQDVKGWHGDRCQMCGSLLRVPGPRQATSEGAHIRPLGEGGHDYTGNVLCLCPSCHTQFDQGGLYLTDDLHVVETVTGTVRRRLATDPRHDVDLEGIRWHRARWARHILPPPPGQAHRTSEVPPRCGRLPDMA